MDAKQAKELFKAEFGAEEWFNGIGLSRTDDGGLGLHLLVDPQHQGKFPAKYMGVPLEVIYISQIKARQNQV